MKFIKNIPGHLFAIYAILVFVATMLVIWIPVFIISFLAEPRRARALHVVFKIWMGVYMPLILCPVSRKGKEHFKKGENYVVVINHNSMMDIPVSSPWIPGPNKTLAKIEMARIPVFGIIYKAGSILVNRKNDASKRNSFAKMEEALHQGIHLCLYPEGTRNKTTQPLQPFFDGAFTTAVKAQKPIVPGVIFNTGSILPIHKQLWLRPKPIKIHFLAPISTEGLTLADVSALKARVHQLMETYYVNNKS